MLVLKTHTNDMPNDHKAPTSGEEYSLIKSQPFTLRDWWVYGYRLTVLFVTDPRLWYTYQIAKRRTGQRHPSRFVQAVLLRLGRNAREVDLNPLHPKGVAVVLRNLKREDVIHEDKAAGSGITDE